MLNIDEVKRDRKVKFIILSIKNDLNQLILKKIVKNLNS